MLQSEQEEHGHDTLLPAAQRVRIDPLHRPVIVERHLQQAHAAAFTARTTSKRHLELQPSLCEVDVGTAAGSDARQLYSTHLPSRSHVIAIMRHHPNVAASYLAQRPQHERVPVRIQFVR